MGRSRVLSIAAAGVLTAAAGWAAWDLAAPVHASLRQFDPHEVARAETAMWRAYYEHHDLRLFHQLAALLRSEYHMPLWRSYLGAYRGARAAVVFQRGHNRAEYGRALPDLERFYRLIRRSSDTPFDVARASRLELEWWIVHRERAAHPPGSLERALAELQSAIYEQPAALFTEHARARAEAMVLRDRRAAAGGVSEDDWRHIAALLDHSWSALRAAAGR